MLDSVHSQLSLRAHMRCLLLCWLFIHYVQFSEQKCSVCVFIGKKCPNLKDHIHDFFVQTNPTMFPYQMSQNEKQQCSISHKYFPCNKNIHKWTFTAIHFTPTQQIIYWSCLNILSQEKKLSDLIRF